VAFGLSHQQKFSLDASDDFSYRPSEKSQVVSLGTAILLYYWVPLPKQNKTPRKQQSRSHKLLKSLLLNTSQSTIMQYRTRSILSVNMQEAIKDKNHAIVGLQIVCDHQATPDLAEDDISVSSTESSMDCDDSSWNARDELANFLITISDAIEAIGDDDISSKSDECSHMGFNSLVLRRTKGFKQARRGISRRKLLDDIEAKAPSSVENTTMANVGRMQSFDKTNNLDVDLEAFLLCSTTNHRTSGKVLADSEWRFPWPDPPGTLMCSFPASA
jgi:hypothetical protein